MRALKGLIALLALGLVACADIKVPDSGRYIVVTRFGNAISVEKIGVLILTDDLRVYQDDTDLGGLFRDGTVAALSKDSPWVYVPSGVHMDDPQLDGDFDHYRSAIIDNGWRKIDVRMQKLKQAAAASQADIVICINESVWSFPTPPIGNPFARDEMVGRGVYTHKTAGFPDRTSLFVAYNITVYDAHNWKSRSYWGVYATPFPKIEWPKPSYTTLPLPPDVVPNVKQALGKIEPPPDLPFVLCYLGLTNITHDPVAHARAYACAQHYGVPNTSFSDVPIYWLTHPQDMEHWNLHQP